MMKVDFMQRKQSKPYEEYVYALDYLPEGRYIGNLRIREPLVQSIGERYFMLLELIARRNIRIEVGERLYVGKGIRIKILRVRSRIRYDELTTDAKLALPEVLEKIVRNREEYFVEFFNKATPITTRLHMLELLPGIGKKTMWEFLEERKKRPFTSFKDISERVPTSDPVKLIVKRIEMELKGDEKYNLFVRRD